MRTFSQVPRIAALTSLLICSSVLAQDEVASELEQIAQAELGDSSASGERVVQFQFDRMPWKDVIRWIADESELALYYEELPQGSFTYSDPSVFTLSEAVSRLNLFLQSEGFALVRSRNLLTLINLQSPSNVKRLNTLAELVQPDELKQRNDQEVVKVIFPLGELDADKAIEELQPFQLMTNPQVFGLTNQLMIVDTAAKLRSVKAVLDAFEPTAMDNGTVVKGFTLEHVSAEDVLVVARPHLGLATDEMIGIDVSISADLQGKNIFVTGIEDKVALIEGLIKSIDIPQVKAFETEAGSELKSYPVPGGNVDRVYDVLKTLLAGENLRLSVDEEADSIIAFATPEIHKQIQGTVAELQASSAEFKVIPLKNVEPAFVISLLEEMLDLPDPFFLDEDEEIDPDAPKIDADPANGRLFVRAKKKDLEEIERIVAGLDVPTTVGDSGVRLVPFQGEAIEATLEAAAEFWNQPNPILLVPSDARPENIETERVLNEEDEVGDERASIQNQSGAFTAWTALDASSRPATPRDTLKQASRLRVLNADTARNEPPIRLQITEQGVLVQSEEAEALDEFESHLRAIMGPGASAVSPPIVFYLKYTKPDAALRMLAELLDGGENAEEAEVGSLVNGSVSSGYSLGSILTSRDGTITMSLDTLTVVADARLNRLIAQGTTEDIDRIESYLKIIDKRTGLTEIETYGSSRIVELVHASATDVAATVREAYAGRIGTSPAANAAAQGKQQNDPRQAKADAKGDSKRGDEQKPPAANQAKAQQAKGAQPKAGANNEPKFTLAVHEASNSLVITAPDQLAEEVERLIKLLDSRSEEAFEVIAPVNGPLLQAVFSPESSESPARRSSNSSSRGGSSGQSRLGEELRRKFGR